MSKAKNVLEISYSEKLLPKLTFILRLNNAVYKLDTKNRLLKILFCNEQCT